MTANAHIRNAVCLRAGSLKVQALAPMASTGSTRLMLSNTFQACNPIDYSLPAFWRAEAMLLAKIVPFLGCVNN